MKKPRRKYSQIPVSQNRGRLGGLIIMVDVGPIDYHHPDGIYISSNTVLPDEIIDAATAWFKMDKFGKMDLTEYLNRMFEAADYSKESI